MELGDQERRLLESPRQKLMVASTKVWATERGGKHGIWNTVLPGLAPQFNVVEVRGRDIGCVRNWCVM